MNKIKFGQVAKVRNGYAFESSDFQDRGVAVIRMSDLNDSFVNAKDATKVSSKHWEKLPAFRIQKGDILIGMSGSVGKVAIYDSALPALQNQRVGILQIKDTNILDTRYLNFFSLTLERELLAFSKGVAVKNISAEQIESVSIYAPKLTEQKRIAAILDKADRLRRQRRFAQTLSDSFLQSAFIKIFGDLQKENRWKWDNLGSQSKIASGVTKGQNFNGKKTVIVPYLRVANVQDGYLDLSEIKFIEALESEAESLKLQQGDILMTEGGDYDKLGRGTIWDAKVKNCIHQNHIFRVRLNKESIIPKFFDTFLRTRYTKSYFLRCAKQTTNLATINMTQLKELPIPLPPLPLQEKFVEIVQKFERVRHQQREAMRQAEHLFQTLLHRAFRGDL